MAYCFKRRWLPHGLIVAVAFTTAVSAVTAATISPLADATVASTPSTTTHPGALLCVERLLNIVAHMDDDLLFLSPDLLHSIGAHACVKTIYLTADDAGHGVARMRDKEAGARAAYAWLATSQDTWSETIDDQVARWELSGGLVQIVGLRLPDGGYGAGARRRRE